MLIRTIVLLLFVINMTIFAKKNSPIEISPIFVQHDSISIDYPFKLYLKSVSVVDSIKNLPLGLTRTGKKTSAQLISKPSIDTIIYKSLSGFLNHKKLNSTEDSARFLLSITILNARISEISQGLTQTMSAELTAEVQLNDPADHSNNRKLIIEAKNSRQALDTTKLAADIFRDTVRMFIQELMKNIIPT